MAIPVAHGFMAIGNVDCDDSNGIGVYEYAYAQSHSLQVGLTIKTAVFLVIRLHQNYNVVPVLINTSPDQVDIPPD